MHRRLVATVLAALTATAAASVVGGPAAVRDDQGSAALRRPRRLLQRRLRLASARPGRSPSVPALDRQLPARHRGEGRRRSSPTSRCGAADTTDFFSEQYPDVPAQLDAVQSNTQLDHDDDRRERQRRVHQLDPECGVAGASTLGQGSPCKDKYGSSFENTIRRRRTRPGQRAAGRPGQGAEGQGRDPRLPVDPADHRRLLPADAGRVRGRALPAAPPGDPERRRPTCGGRDRGDVRRPQHGVQRSRRLQADRGALGRAGARRAPTR